MRDEVRRFAVFTSGVAELTRNRAEEVVRNVFGEESAAKVSEMVTKLLETSQQNRHEVMELIRKELSNQSAILGLVTKDELDSLEARVTALEALVHAPPTGDLEEPASPTQPGPPAGSPGEDSAGRARSNTRTRPPTGDA
jgi:polyhydroxyalkanoate synthesis regulator phasin